MLANILAERWRQFRQGQLGLLLVCKVKECLGQSELIGCNIAPKQNYGTPIAVRSWRGQMKIGHSKILAHIIHDRDQL